MVEDIWHIHLCATYCSIPERERERETSTTSFYSSSLLIANDGNREGIRGGDFQKFNNNYPN